VHVLIQIGLVALGSSLGGLLRWGVTVACGRCFGTAFPWGTFFINISGSLFLGWFTTLVRERMLTTGISWLRSDNLHLLLAVGFTGAYTTFSTFEFEAHGLLSDRDSLKGTTYILGSLFFGLLAVHLGTILAKAE